MFGLLKTKRRRDKQRKGWGIGLIGAVVLITLGCGPSYRILIGL